MKFCVASRMIFAIAILLCAAFLVHATFAQKIPQWEEGRITNVDYLDAKSTPSSSDPFCAALGARIYTIETDKQTFKMLGALVQGLSDDERQVYFFLDDKRNAHFENPNGGEQPLGLVAYEVEWKEVPTRQEASPRKRRSRDWRDAKLMGVQPLVVLGTLVSCTVSRPVGWIYILDVDGVTYDAVWNDYAPLQLWMKEDTWVAWRGSDRIYLIDNDGKERQLAVKKRTQPTSERAPRYTN